MTRSACAAGFSMLELVVSLALTTLLITAAAGVLAPSAHAFGAHPERVDMQQRARSIADTVSGDLRMAGAGPYLGTSVGSLAASFAPVIPRRIGLTNADAATSVRSDAVTLTYVPATYAQTTARAPVSEATGLAVDTAANCPASQPLCGIPQGGTVAVFDRTGQWDAFTVTSIAGGTAQVRAHASGARYTYPAGSRVVGVESRTYYLDAAASQLRMSDGYQSDVPVADNVTAFTLEYFGTPQPPSAPRPPAGTANCLYDTAGNPILMPTLAAPEGAATIVLPLAMFGDGPWCGSGGTMFDADLLRVRGVRVTVRVQAALAAFRSTGSLFSSPGISRSSGLYLPDDTMTFTVWPANLHGA